MSEGLLEKPLARLAILAMTTLATVAVALAIAEPDRSASSSAASSLILMLPVALIAWIIGKRASSRGDAKTEQAALPAAVVLGLFALFIASLGVGLAREVISRHRVMPEILLVIAMRDLTLGMAALSHRPVLARLCALLDLFLVCVSSAMAEGPAMIAIVALFAAAGCLWLMALDWGTVRPTWHFEGRARFPVAVTVFIIAIVGAVFVAAATGPDAAANALLGLVPTSGGTEWNDPDSLGGVNDGDNEVSASENPQSVGFTSSEVYLETDRPSLYDAINEQYGEPLKPKKQERMIPLTQQEVLEQKQRPSENLQAGREFPLVRRKPKRPERRPGEREAKALVYVKGPCPIHLPLVAYDRFDGRSWSEGVHCSTRCPLEREGRGTWLRASLLPSTAFAGTVSHKIKIGTLDSSPLPVPSWLERLRVGSVDQPDFFGWAQEGIVKMQGRTVPAGTLIEVESFTVDPSRITSAEFPEPMAPLTDRHLALAAGYRVDPSVAELAGLWVSGHLRGWGQIEAVVSALRESCVHDRSAVIPEDCSDPVRHFLLDARRGADYQFATAAAVILRMLGYPSRVVSGLYASPDRYDSRTRHTPILAEDSHFWAEVRLSNGTWVAIEPTPGYALMGPTLSWGQRVKDAVSTFAAWAKSHAVALSVFGVLLILSARFRKELADAVLTAAWWLATRRDPALHAVRTFRLIERRSRWAGLPRPGFRTPRQWYGAIAEVMECGASQEFSAVIASIEACFYASPEALLTADSVGQESLGLCRRVVQTWTISKLRACRKDMES